MITYKYFYVLKNPSCVLIKEDRMRIYGGWYPIPDYAISKKAFVLISEYSNDIEIKRPNFDLGEYVSVYKE